MKKLFYTSFFHVFLYSFAKKTIFTLFHIKKSLTLGVGIILSIIQQKG